MAVISAAIAAVAAISVTTVASAVATISTAVVAVSAAIGTVGAVVGVVGAVTGNKDLMFAGKIMGYVGLAGGLAGGLIGGVGGALSSTSGMTFAKGFADTYAGYSQHLSQAWDKGVGSFFSGGNKVTGAAGSTPTAPTGSAAPSPNGAVTSNGVNPLDHAIGGTGPSSPVQVTSLKPISDGSVIQGTGGLAAPSAATIQAPTAAIGGAPSVGVPNAPGALANMNNAASWVPQQTTGLVEQATNAAAGMPDWMKYSMMTTGAQGITGLASGYFQGAQAEEQLAEQQRVTNLNEAQRQRLNQQANDIPLIQFRR